MKVFKSTCKGIPLVKTGQIQENVLRLGGFHIEKVEICCVVKYLEASRIKVEKEILSQNIVNSVIYRKKPSRQ